MNHTSSVKEASSNDTASLGATMADKMLTMLWTASKGWNTPVIRPFGPLPLFPSANVLHYGLSVFEALKAHRTSDGGIALFRPDEHVERLNHSAQRLTLPRVPCDFTQMLATYADSVRSWVPSEEGSSLYIRIVLFGSEARLGVKPSSEAILIIMASPIRADPGANPANTFQKGMRLCAYPHFSRASPGGIGDCKTAGNYAAAMYPTMLAKEQGFGQVLWLSDPTNRLVTEAGVMNVFFVIDQNLDGKLSLITPKKDGTILDGITQRSIVSLAIDMGLHVHEKDISINDVFESARNGSLVQIFGTGTASIVRHISNIDCDGESADLSICEEKHDLSVRFRRELLRIFRDANHPWTMPIPENGFDCKVQFSSERHTSKDIHSWW